MVSSRRRLATATATATAATPEARPRVDADADVDTELCRAEINAANNTELRANAQVVLDTIRTSRPKNTSLAYEPKQQEFRVRRTTRYPAYTTY